MANHWSAYTITKEGEKHLYIFKKQHNVTNYLLMVMKVNPFLKCTNYAYFLFIYPMFSFIVWQSNIFK